MSYAEALARTAPLYDRVKSVIPPIEWPAFADDIEAILALKRQRNAVIQQTAENHEKVARLLEEMRKKKFWAWLGRFLLPDNVPVYRRPIENK